LAGGVLVAGFPADPLVPSGAEGPAPVLGRGAVPGDQDAADIAGHSGVVERLVKLVHGVRAEGVPHFRPVEGDSHSAFARAFFSAPVIRDVGEIEARYRLPYARIEQLRDTGILHTWDNRGRGEQARGPPRNAQRPFSRRGTLVNRPSPSGKIFRGDRLNPSTAQAAVIVDELVRNGVHHVVLAPGSRNAPLAFAVHRAAQEGQLELHVRIDERSAGFLALGLAARTHRPVAVACTSGTAATNLHPAVSEAYHPGIPLVVLTADRPPELRAAGANQTIDQHRLFGTEVRFFDELAVAEQRPGQNSYWRSQVCRACAAALGRARSGPVHLNLPFREPLVPTGDDEWCEPLTGRPGGRRWTEVTDYSRAPSRLARVRARRGMVLVGDGGIDGASAWAERYGWPVLAEAGGVGLSGTTAISTGMWLLNLPEFLRAHKPEQVLCVGRPTVFRQVQRLLADP